MKTRGYAGGLGQELSRHLLAIPLVLILEAIALGLVLLLPRWLVQVLPSASQAFVLFLIGALTGYLAELILRGPRPLGYPGSVLFGMMGAWVGSNVLSRSPSWDWAISTSQGNVPIVTSAGLALLFTLLWRTLTGIPALALWLNQRGVKGSQWLRQNAQTSLNGGMLVGFLSGTTIGWPALLIVLLQDQIEEATFLTWVVVVLLGAAVGFGWWRLLRKHGFRVFGQPLDRWWQLSGAGCLLGLAIYVLVILLGFALPT